MSTPLLTGLPTIVAIGLSALFGPMVASDLPEDPGASQDLITEDANQDSLESSVTEELATPNHSAHKRDSTTPLAEKPTEALTAGFTVTPGSAHPGESVEMSGSCGEGSGPPDTIRANFSHTTLSREKEGETYFDFTPPFDSLGQVAHSLQIPAEAKPGDYEVRFSCSYDDTLIDTGFTSFTILSSETPPPTKTPQPTVQPTEEPTPEQKPKELAETGTERWPIGIALATILAGSGALLLTQAGARRKQSRA